MSTQCCVLLRLLIRRIVAVKTRETVRAELNRCGKTIADWSRENSCNADIVRGVLLGRIKGIRGEAHKVAVLLGLKDGVIVEDEGHDDA